MIQEKFIMTLAISSMVLLLQNCGSDEPKPAAPTSVYIGGQVRTSSTWVAAFSKDGIENKVGSPDNVYSYVQSMAVSGKDIYMAGYSQNVACYWKNFEKHTIPLSAGADGSDCSGGMVVNGSDVYLVVKETLTTGAVALKYLKNGVATTCALTTGGYVSTSTVGNGLAVSGNDVYVVGAGDDADHFSHAGYWKNGTFVQVETQASNAQAIAVVDGDVYVAGYYYDYVNDARVATYWKNGNAVALGSTAANQHSSAYDIEVVDGVVYVAGSREINGDSKAVYWKDGEEVMLTPEAEDAFAENIEVRNGDVYVVAEYYNGDGFITKIWKNEVLVTPFDGTSTNFYGVALFIK